MENKLSLRCHDNWSGNMAIISKKKIFDGSFNSLNFFLIMKMSLPCGDNSAGRILNYCFL